MDDPAILARLIVLAALAALVAYVFIFGSNVKPNRDGNNDPPVY